MPVTTIDYKGIDVSSPDPVNPGGQLIQNALKEIVDRIRPCHTTTTNPTANNDGLDTAGLGKIFEINSRWINTSTDEEFVCLDDTAGAAVWSSTTSGAVVTGKADKVTGAVAGNIATLDG